MYFFFNMYQYSKHGHAVFANTKKSFSRGSIALAMLFYEFFIGYILTLFSSFFKKIKSSQNFPRMSKALALRSNGVWGHDPTAGPPVTHVADDYPGLYEMDSTIFNNILYNH